MTTVVISQPMLFPWSGMFEQLALADVFLYLDDAQFSKGSFTNRVQILHNGASKWLTVPLQAGGNFRPISELEAIDEDWKRRHRAFVAQALAGAAYVNDAMTLLDDVYTREAVCEILIASIELPANYLGIGRSRKVHRTSSLNIPGRASERVLDLVRTFGGTRYLTGHGAANYMDHEAFERAGVSVEYMDYSKTPYPQAGERFTPFVSILDMIAHCGPAASGYLRPATIPWRTFLGATDKQTPHE